MIPTMKIAIAYALALNLVSAGTPARAVDVGQGNGIVVIEGRPGCHAYPMGGDPKSPVIVCEKPKK